MGISSSLHLVEPASLVDQGSQVFFLRGTSSEHREAAGIEKSKRANSIQMKMT